MNYNHHDEPASRLPLPIRIAGPHCAPSNVPHDAEARTISIVAGKERALSLRLVSDSPHLLRFFEGNWSLDGGREPQATIVALKRGAATYGLSSSLDSSRWYSPHARTVWIYGSE